MEESTYQEKKTKDRVQDSDIRALTLQLRYFTAEQRRTNDRFDRAQKNLFSRMMDVEKVDAVLVDSNLPKRVTWNEKRIAWIIGVGTGAVGLFAGRTVISLIAK